MSKPWGALDARGRRAIAVQKLPGDQNCIPFEGELLSVLSPVPGYYPDCIAGNDLPVGIRIRNNGTTAFSGATVAWQVGSGSPSTANIAGTINPAVTLDFTFPDSLNLPGVGSYDIKVWISVPGDGNPQNDTVSFSIEVHSSGTETPAYSQNFDAFATCNTAWGCADISCALSQNWFNVPNNPAVHGDSIDFRTHTGATGSGGTGPSSDHTTGNGNYLYLETSGNSGSGCQNKQAELHSPCFDLRGTNQAQLSFWYHMYGSSIGDLHVDAFVDGKWDLDVMPAIVGEQGNAWDSANVDLGAYAGKIIFVRFRATTGAGFRGDLAIDDINLTTLPFVAFSADQQTICEGDTVQFSNQSSYADTYNWQISPAGFSFAGGSTSASRDPQVVFNTAGLYSVTLIGTNSLGADTLVETALIEVDAPLAIATAADTALCPIVSFSGQSSAGDADYWEWDFGDGSPVVTTQNPTHDYSAAGNGSYTVTLIAGNTCGEDSTTLTVNVNCLVASFEGLSGRLRLYPNPAQEQLWVDFGLPYSGKLEVSAFDVSGRKLLAKTWAQGSSRERMALDVSLLSAGIYVLEVRYAGQVWRSKFAVER